MSTAPLAAPAAATRPPAEAATLRTMALARLGAFAALCLLGLLGWSTLLAGAAGAGPPAMALVAAGAGALLALLPAGASPLRRGATVLGACALLLACALLSAGVDPAQLGPRRWGEVVAGVADGLVAIPGITSPYRGDDAWVRTTVLLGGGLLTALATLQAFWPARERTRLVSPVPAAMSLTLLWGIAVVEVPPQRPLLSGALFALLLSAFLFADRVPAAQAAPAAVCVLSATVLAIGVAPAFDSARPWLDLKRISEDVANTGTVGYQWDHDYGPLDWSRDGKELLRIKAQRSAYWKAEVLNAFDGHAWQRTNTLPSFEGDGEVDTSHPAWVQTIDVRVRGLRSAQFITAGQAQDVAGETRKALPVAGGTFVPERGILRRGAHYKAVVYTPDPTSGELDHAGTEYPKEARFWLTVELPDAAGTANPAPEGRRPEVTFAPFDSGDANLVTTGAPGLASTDAVGAIAGTGLERTYALARRLRAGAKTPHDYINAVLARVQRGATYTERPGLASNPLDRFLFDVRRGYCQHFSGAMALLLRMGGVPARVAVGFAPGRQDTRTGEYVVRDLDAHSWVEAYFPRYGWVTFDPTPAAAPPREQSADVAQELGLRRTRGGPGGDRQSDPTAGGAALATPGTGLPLAGLLLLSLVGLAALGGGVALAVRRRAGRGPCPPELRELERALRICGRPPPAGATLSDLERVVGRTPEARGYLRALAAQRFASAGEGPSVAQRRALRRELAGGLGSGGRLRAWLALPPRPLRG